MNKTDASFLDGEKSAALEARLRSSDFRWRQHLLSLWDLQRRLTS